MCRLDDDAGKLLCCELCPRVYHLGCLTPPLASVPSEDWFCPRCAPAKRLAEVERILARRPRIPVRSYALQCLLITYLAASAPFGGGVANLHGDPRIPVRPYALMHFRVLACTLERC